MQKNKIIDHSQNVNIKFNNATNLPAYNDGEALEQCWIQVISRIFKLNEYELIHIYGLSKISTAPKTTHWPIY